MAGKETHQIACIFCGRNRHITGGFNLGEMTIDPSEYGVFNVRSVGAGPGRGHKGVLEGGFPTVERLNIIEALEDPRFSELAGQVKDRLITIVRSYIENGVLSIEELS